MSQSYRSKLNQKPVEVYIVKRGSSSLDATSTSFSLAMLTHIPVVLCSDWCCRLFRLMKFTFRCCSSFCIATVCHEPEFPDFSLWLDLSTEFSLLC